MQRQDQLRNYTWRVIACLLVVGLIVLACRPIDKVGPDRLNGTVLLWHDLGEEDAQVLEQVLAGFMGIHPGVRADATSISTPELRLRFETAVASGLGPDLLLGPSSWIRPLADSGLIQPMDGLVESQYWEQFLPASIAAIQYNDQHYAIPESLRMMGLYYNKRLVDQPAATLAELMEQAASGKKVGMSPEFTDMFWGIRAFGGELLDENGHVVLDRGGFANWLAWLVTVEDGPNILIDRDRETLRTLFRDGDLAYLVDGSWAAQELQNSIGEDRLGVAPLPAGPIGPASPLLETNAFMLSIASSNRQSELAIELGQFITNPEQATTLMRRGDRIPASDRVRVSPSVDPVAFPFVTQARNAIPFQNSLVMDTVIEIGSGAYNRTLQGVEGPVQVANSTTQAINRAINAASVNVETPSCQHLGVLEIGHILNETGAETLIQVIDRFRERCPYVAIRVSHYRPETLRDLLKSSAKAAPDIALVPSQWVSSLAGTQSVQDMTGQIPAEALQAFQPSAVQSWTVKDRLYGVPFTLELPALFYNKALVDDPARTLTDLITEGTAGRPTALNVAFGQAYWGVPAFGGRLFDTDRRVVLDQGGFVDWLAWLQEARVKARAILDTDDERLLSLFLDGTVNYYVGGPEALIRAEAVLGKENVGISRLPTGPVADAAPLLTSKGFVIPSGTDEGSSALAQLFIQHATDLASQEYLMSTGRLAPIHIGVDYSQDGAISVFLERANNAVAYPNIAEMAAVEEFGGQAYEPILNERVLSEAELEALVAKITADMNRANGSPQPKSQED